MSDIPVIRAGAEYWLYPEEEPQTVTFPQEKDEMLPEDMLTEGGDRNADRE